jgi:hypothetical protein
MVIGNGAFLLCKALVEVTFEAPSRLRVIRKYAFAECRALTSIAFPGSLRAIRGWTFRSCLVLRTVTFESGGVTPEIHPEAFANCPDLDMAFLNK